MSAHSGEDQMSVENMWVLFACVAMSLFAYAFLKPMCNCSCKKKEPLPPPPKEPQTRTIKINPARAKFRLFPPGEAYYLGGPPRRPVEPKKKKKPKVKDKLNQKWRQCVNTIIANNAIRDLSTQLPIQRAFSKGDKDMDGAEDPSNVNNEDNHIIRDPNAFSGLPVTANNCCGSYSNGGGTMNDFARLVQLVRTLEKEQEKEREKEREKENENAINNPDEATKTKVKAKEESNGSKLDPKKTPLKRGQTVNYMDEELGEDEIRPVPSLTPTPRKEKPSQLSSHYQHTSQSSQNVQIQKPRKLLLKPNPKISPELHPVPLRVPEPEPEPEPAPGPSQLVSQGPKGAAKHSIAGAEAEAGVDAGIINKAYDSSGDTNTTTVEIRNEVTNAHKLKRVTIRPSRENYGHDYDHDYDRAIGMGISSVNESHIQKLKVGPKKNRSSDEDDKFDHRKLKRITIRRADEEGNSTLKRITIRRSAVENVQVKSYSNPLANPNSIDIYNHGSISHSLNHCYDNYSYLASTMDLRSISPAQSLPSPTPPPPPEIPENPEYPTSSTEENRSASTTSKRTIIMSTRSPPGSESGSGTYSRSGTPSILGHGHRFPPEFQHQIIEKPLMMSRNNSENTEITMSRKYLSYPHEQYQYEQQQQLELSQNQPTIISVSPSASSTLPKRC